MNLVSGGLTVWLTGIPSAGKTTLAEASARQLEQLGFRVQVLDGDAVRAELGGDLGYDPVSRHHSAARLGWISSMLASHGVVAIVSAVTPYRLDRDEVRNRHRANGTKFLEIHVDVPLETAVQRDVKGLYRRQADGALSELTGIDAPYEAPLDPELHIDTREPVPDCVDAIVSMVTAALAGGSR